MRSAVELVQRFPAMRIGILGGSFDPIHLGHLIMAEQSREQARLDEVWFIPAATAPHKLEGAAASAKQRLEMVQLAIAGNPSFRADSIELDRGEVSYTVDTLRALSRRHPEHAWFLIIGSDSASQLKQWREPAEICRLATPLVYQRPGQLLEGPALRDLVPAEQWGNIDNHRIVGPLIDISSTYIRRQRSAGLSIRYLVPRAVEKYIETHQLYCP